MLASSKHKYSKTLAFPDTYYELIINVLQSVELFCAYDEINSYYDGVDLFQAIGGMLHQLPEHKRYRQQRCIEIYGKEI